MRDDMVIRPRLKQPAQPSTRAIDDRKARAQARTGNKGGGTLSRLAKLRAAQRLQRIRRARLIARRQRLASAAGRVASSLGGARLGAAFAGGPVRLGIAAILATKLIRWRLNGDAPYEVLLNREVDAFTGDIPQQILAQRDARQAVLGNPIIAQIVGQQGRVNGQISELYDTHYRRALQRRQGEEKFDLDARFHRDSKADVVVLSAFKSGYHVPEGVR